MESGFSIECQHGERECVGNIVQACAMKYQPDMWTQVRILDFVGSVHAEYSRFIFSTACLQPPSQKLQEQLALRNLGWTMTLYRSGQNNN